MERVSERLSRGSGLVPAEVGASGVHYIPDNDSDDPVKQGWIRLRQFVLLLVCLSGLLYAIVAGHLYFDPNYRWFPFLRLSPQTISQTFELCADNGVHDACVADGSHFWRGGAYYKVYGVDTPNRWRSACPAEAALAERSAFRLRNLLNAGPFQLTQILSQSRYLMKNGRPVGFYYVTLRRADAYFSDALFDAGLARHIILLYRRNWCA